MRKPQNKKKLPNYTRNKQLHIFIPILLFAVVGAYFVVNSYAAKMICTPPSGGACKIVANPPLSAGCGYDIAILGDRSESMAPSMSAMVNDMKNLVSTMQGTNSQFAVGDLGPLGPISAFTGDIATTHSVINHAAMYANDYRDYRIISQMDKRPNNQNLIILFTDTVNTLMPETSADIVKQSGTRVLIVRYPTVDTWGDPDDPEYELLRTYLAGPDGYTGSILNANTVFSTGSSKIADYATALAAHAKQPCVPVINPGGGDPGGSPGGGPGGDGPGSEGEGPGAAGQGPGTDPGTGAAGGGGGSSATTQGNNNNSTPSSSGQGDRDQTKLEPSPFFDGRTYAPGSDPIDKALGNLSIGGKRIIHGWLYLLVLFAVIGNLVAGYFLWWRRMSLEEQTRVKAKLHLGK